MSFELQDLPKREFRKILKLLEPEGFWTRATKLGAGDPVFGAPAAMRERRAQIRKIVNKYRKKHGRGLDLEIALLMRTLGWPLMGQYRHPTRHMTSSFRPLACAFWPQGQPIPGGIWIDVKDHDFFQVYRGTIRAVSQMLKDKPMYNLAVLDNRVWQRNDSQVMVHIETRTDLWSPCFSAVDKTDEWLKRRLRKSMKSVVKFSKKALSKTAIDLMIQWAEYGFLGSPAGAMISGCQGSDIGWAALVPANGIPLAVCVNRVKHGKCFIGVTPDHRAFDGKRDLEGIYDYLEQSIPLHVEVLPYEEDLNHRWSHGAGSRDQG